MKKLRIGFVGSAAFSIPFLASLLQKEIIEVVAVLTRPDQPAGRGQKEMMNPLKTYAVSRGLTLLEPTRLSHAISDHAWLAQQALDLFVVVAFGALIPKSWLALGRLGWINVHPSWLPRWRGAAPIARTILAGDAVSALTIMQMDAGLDTGQIYWQEPMVLSKDENTESLAARFGEVGPACLLRVLEAYQIGSIPILRTQPDSGICYADKLTKDEAKIHWDSSAETIIRQIRGYYPWPVAWTWLGKKRFKLLHAREAPEMAEALDLLPGMLHLDPKQKLVYIRTRKGLIHLQAGQLEGQVPRAKESLYQVLAAYPNTGFTWQSAVSPC